MLASYLVTKTMFQCLSPDKAALVWELCDADRSFLSQIPPSNCQITPFPADGSNNARQNFLGDIVNDGCSQLLPEVRNSSMMAAAIDERPLPPGWSQKYHEETGRM